MPSPNASTAPYTSRRFGNAGAYRIPDDGKFRTINFSGGRSSGYMLWHLLDAHQGKLPDTVKVIFCNTGKERVETLDFVHTCETHWGVPIHWLEFIYRPEAKGGRHDPKRDVRIVDYKTASRDGQPFKDLNSSRRMLPNAVTRACTAELKVSTTDRFARWYLHWPKRQTRNIVGFRYDEPARWKEGLVARCDIEFPMVHARVAKHDVAQFWAAQPFDLAIHSARGNCDLCFLKDASNLIATIRENPDLADWWINEEDRTRNLRQLRKQNVAQFSQRWSYRQLREYAHTSPTLPFPIDANEENFSCFCTD